MRLRTGYSLSLLICSLVSPSVGAATEADPPALPVAARQAPDWDAYAALGVRTAVAGFVYDDPVTGATVHKLTSAEFPVENLFAVHDYSEGGPFISAEWGDGMHTIAVRVIEDSETISTWLVDYQRGTSIASSWRRSPIFLTELAIAFSSRLGLERIVYFVFRNRLYRYNTQTMKREGETHIPFEGVRVEDVEITPNWLQSSSNDAWFVFHAQSEEKVYAFNRLNGDLRARKFSGLDEPALDRDGGYVLIRDGGGGEPSCWRSGLIFEEVWHLWNLSNDTVACRGGLVDGRIYAAHTGWGRGYFPSQNLSLTNSPTFYFDPASGAGTETADYADANYFYADHHALQWLQGPREATQWYYGSNFNEGRVSATGWSVYNADIYRTGINWTPEYQKPAIGVRAVYQTAPGNSNLLRHTLAPAASIGAVTEGSYFYDAPNAQLYVWAQGGGSPANRTLLAAPGPVHDGIGARRMDGSDVRLVAHHYSWPGGRVAYRQMPLATTSPDGKLIMFTSNMGLRDLAGAGRLDVFVVEMPVSRRAGGGAEVPVAWTSVVNAIAAGNSLYEACGCGNSGARSEQEIYAGDGYMEFTAADDHQLHGAGLGTANADNSSSDIEFAIELAGNGYAEIRESGVFRARTPYVAGDRFRVAVEDGDVNYYIRKGDGLVLIYSSESPATLAYPLHVDTALPGPATSVVGAVIASGRMSAGGAVIGSNASN